MGRNNKNGMPAVFLDRDGLINEKPPEHDYVKNWHEFKFLPGIISLIKKIKACGYLVVVVTNQRGIARGLMSEETVKGIHRRMAVELKKQKAAVDAIYCCPHGKNDNCLCRKPKPGLILKAARDLNLDLSKSILIGDSRSDIMAGEAAGCKTLLIESDNVKQAEGCFDENH